ncbi:hypothetical protein [Corallococcus coralloides]|uniref:hypothetical protein n=1 Tax=Corallococcus coralloides TaxID=184914 RepID=UPI0002F7CED6|nr:hypothetical protein [Corallococcus coralloides]
MRTLRRAFLGPLFQPERLLRNDGPRVYELGPGAKLEFSKDRPEARWVTGLR